MSDKSDVGRSGADKQKRKRNLSHDKEEKEDDRNQKRFKNEPKDLTPYFDSIPIEILHSIFQYLSFWDLFDNVQLVVSKLLSASESNE
jgi:hypothetical protein